MANATTSGDDGGLDINVSGSGEMGDLTGKESSLSNYAGEYVTNMMGKAEALADEPYQAYTGPLTAGESELQTQAFEGIGGLSVPTGAMGEMTADSLSPYMNPYLEMALQPQVNAAIRNADIQRMKDASRLTKSGSYGGSRQAVMEAEGNRALGDTLSGIYGTGYRDAFDRATDAFAADRGYGLEALQMQQDAGAEQRAIEAEGIQADKDQFYEEMDDPYKKLQFQQSFLQNLPLESQDYISAMGNQLTAAGGDAAAFYKLIEQLLK
jgi:hypothetical protein